MNKKTTDILIVGGGLTGAILLLALKQLNIDCILLDANGFEQRLKEDFDARSLALSPASVRILDTLDIWPVLQKKATAIEFIHVSDKNRFGATRLSGSKEQALGYVLEMQDINQALHQLLPKTQILAPAKLESLDTEAVCAQVSYQGESLEIKAKLIVAADGANSFVRTCCGLPVEEKKYHQTAIVSNVLLAKPHQNQAFERFTSEGPLALLPMSEQRMSLVWAMSPRQAEILAALDEKAFRQALQKAFGYRLGRFVRCGKTALFPLKHSFMPNQAVWPVVFVGNAAHTLHPVAGQGFNLGLRDVAMLAQRIAGSGINQEMLAEYSKARQYDQKAITHITNGLIYLFTHTNPLFKIGRNLGMIAMDNIPPLRNSFARHARGFGGEIPDLACGFALKEDRNTNKEPQRDS